MVKWATESHETKGYTYILGVALIFDNVVLSSLLFRPQIRNHRSFPIYCSDKSDKVAIEAQSFIGVAFHPFFKVSKLREHAAA